MIRQGKCGRFNIGLNEYKNAFRSNNYPPERVCVIFSQDQVFDKGHGQT
jgi:hypothetical protein